LWAACRRADQRMGSYIKWQDQAQYAGGSCSPLSYAGRNQQKGGWQLFLTKDFLRNH